MASDDFRFNVLVGAIPLRNGEDVLLLQRSDRERFMPGAWGLPSGKIEYGEDLVVAVLRELREESGIEGRVERLVGYSTFLSNRDGIRLHNLQVNFEVTVLTDRVSLDDSNQAARWMRLSDIPTSDLDEFTRTTIAQLHGPTLGALKP